MKKLLSEFFAELGYFHLAKEIASTNQFFRIKIFCKMFEYYIKSGELIVSKSRAKEMLEQYNKKKEGFLDGSLDKI